MSMIGADKMEWIEKLNQAIVYIEEHFILIEVGHIKIERYIKYYNEKRIKEKLGWMSPVQYRLNALAA